MNTTKTLLLFILISLLFDSHSHAEESNEYVKDACSVTRYEKLCIRTLTSFSRAAKRSPTKWARAGVSVAISEAKSVSHYLRNLRAKNSMKGRRKLALLDCVECVQDALDNLHQSLAILRKLSGETFDTEMGDVSTWMSTALTDEDTCLDGFEDDDVDAQQLVKRIKDRVKKVRCITSNALALVNKLATTGPHS